MKTVIMAGGRGTRIQELFPDIPKPMIPIAGKPVLEHELISLRNQGFKDIILTVSYMGEKIRDYFGNGNRLGIRIEYFTEEQPLGNAGALFKLSDKLTEDFLLLIADAMFDVDFNRMLAYHRRKNALATLFTHPNSHPFDSSLIIANEDCSIENWLTKEDRRPLWYKNRVNAGLQIINPAALELSGVVGAMVGKEDTDGNLIKVDMDRQILKPLCKTGRMFAYDSPEYCKDMGTPERFAQVNSDYLKGVVKAKNLSKPQKAIFLDRDGTINKYVGFLRNIEDFELLPNVAEAIKKINSSDYLCVVITNQPVIARGEVTIPELNQIHNKLETELGKNGAYIDGLYYCPHHPHKGYKGEVIELKVDCLCRKPKPGLLLQASRDFNIDLENSWMVGDSEIDIKAGKNAGCRTALIGNEEYGQDMNINNLKEFVDRLLC